MRDLARKFAMTWLIGLLVMAAVGPVRVPAQEPAQPKPQRSNSNQNMGPGHQLAHETLKAAGLEKDETAEFKQSEAVRLIARVTTLDLQQSYWLCVLLNFVVVAAVIVIVWNRYLPRMFRHRTSGIQKAMFEAQQASAEARRRLAEIEARLSKIDEEIGVMRAAADKEANAEESRIQAAADEERRRIVEAAGQEIAAAAKAARRQLTAHAADLAVALARKQIRVTDGTDQLLVRNFAANLAVTPDNIGKETN
jgi:F-type H+-transporting ATPase subunit b